MRFPSIKSILIFTLAMVLLTLVAGYGILSWQRSRAVRVVCSKANAAHPGDRIEALFAYMDSEETGLDEKNRVIWVLGELRDERALNRLQAMVSSEACDHERAICQHELRKAIRKIKGEIPNPYFWQRHGGG